MGIVNVTPDSFSDGGQYFKPEEAVRRARNLIDDGADIVDLGGESTRPGATPLGWEEEWTRLEPVLRELTAGTVPVSVDTYHPETAEKAIAAGARIINCVSPGAVPAMLEMLKTHAEVELVIPFRRGVDSASTGCGGDFASTGRGGDFASTGCGADSASTGCGADFASVRELIDRIYLDPMIGFGTTREEDLALLKSVPELAKLGRVLIGASRKRIVRKLVMDPDSSESRRQGNAVGKLLGGSVGIAVWCAMKGVAVVRVHDVKETVQALRAVEALGA